MGCVQSRELDAHARVAFSGKLFDVIAICRRFLVLKELLMILVGRMGSF